MLGWNISRGSDILYEKSGGSLNLRKQSGGEFRYFARHMSNYVVTKMH